MSKELLTNSAFAILTMTAEILSKAVQRGQAINWTVNAGDELLPPVTGSDGRLYETSRLVGSYEINITVSKPSSPLTFADVQRRVEAIQAAAGDSEAAHALEDGLFVDVLRTIAAGTPSAAALAQEALSSRRLEFARRCS